MPLIETKRSVGRCLVRALFSLGTGALRRMLLGYFDVTVVGLRNLPTRGPVIVAANHPCAIDGLLLYLLLPRRLQFIAHHELFRHPLTRFVVSQMGYIDAGLRGTAMARAERTLRAGRALVVFPEAGPYEAGRMELMHQGVAVLALHSGAPVLPLGFAGAAEAFPAGSLLPRPGRIVIQIDPPLHEPLTAGTLGAGEIVAAVYDIRHAIKQAERVARARLQTKAPPRRWLRVAACGLVFLPIVAAMTLLGRDVAVRPEQDR